MCENVYKIDKLKICDESLILENINTDGVSTVEITNSHGNTQIAGANTVGGIMTIDLNDLSHGFISEYKNYKIDISPKHGTYDTINYNLFYTI